MPRFRFKLQRVLEIRKHKEELLKNEFASIRREYAHEESILFELISQREREMDGMRRHLLQHTIPLEEMLWHYTYLAKVNAKIHEQKERLQRLKEKMDKIKQRLIVASQEKRIMERLKERRFEDHRRKEERVEEAFLDEIALSMHARGANQLSYRR